MMKAQLIHAEADLRFSCRKITNIFPSRKVFGEKISFSFCKLHFFPIFAPNKPLKI